VAQACGRNPQRWLDLLGDQRRNLRTATDHPLCEKIGADGIRRCGIVLNHEVVPTATALRRPFQGWRYLKPEDAPADLAHGRGTEDALPVELNRALAEIGVL